MKKIAVLLLFTLTLFGCSKEVIEPDLSQEIKGNYEVYYFQLGEDKVNLPMNGISMGIKIAPITKTTANYYLTVNLQGDITTDDSEVELSGTLENVELIDKDTKDKIGTVRGGQFEINIVTEDGQRFVIKAKK